MSDVTQYPMMSKVVGSGQGFKVRFATETGDVDVCITPEYLDHTGSIELRVEADFFPANVKPRIVKQAEAAEYLNVSPSLLEKDRWRGGNIPYLRIGKGAIRYNLDHIDEYLARKGQHRDDYNLMVPVE